MITGWIVWGEDLTPGHRPTRWWYLHKREVWTGIPDEAEVFATRKDAEAAAFEFAVKHPEYIDHIGVRSIRDEYERLEYRPLDEE